MTLRTDPNMQAVLQFMEMNVEADKLIDVAMTIALLAPILWPKVERLERKAPLLRLEYNHEQRSTATQSLPVQVDVDDGSVAEVGSQLPR